MQITIYDIKLLENLTEQEILNYCLKKFRINKSNILDFKLVKKSLDLRIKNNPFYIYQVVIELNEIERKNKYLKDKKVKFDTTYSDEIVVNKLECESRPIIVGSGPAGMFCAYIMAMANLKPIIFERGSMVNKRVKDVENFFNNDILDEESNVCFGEGGAGTFSDGKLTTNLNDPRIKFILKTFVKFGAKESLYYDNLPHVGTDKLRICMENMRNEIIGLGGEFHFDTKVVDVTTNRVKVVENNEEKIYNSPYIVLAIGHSAVDTFEMLVKNGFNLAPKPFSIGARIEHLQSKINLMQYGMDSNIHDAATYKAAVHLPSRDVYTFCMCPGGYVVGSSSRSNTVVTNGMSYEARDGVNSNSALLVNIKVEDFYKGNPLDGLYFQEKIEKACYLYSNSYKAPCNLVKEFLVDEVATGFRSVKPTYTNKTIFASFKEILPDYVINALKDGIIMIDKKLKGFLDDDAILTIVESRSSSPVRILRENYESNIKGVYPIGEGAGYAGGITSSALDGIKCALKIIDDIMGGV